MRVAVAAAAAITLLAASSGSTQVLTGPDAPAAFDAQAPHAEFHLAADPRDARTLVGGAIVLSRADGSPETHIYASTDAGSSWRWHVLTEESKNGGGDPQVMYGADGTAYFATLGMGLKPNGRPRASLLVARSTDRGRTWSPAKDLDPTTSWDHEQFAADWYSKRFKNRVYLAALYGYPDYSIGVWHSSNSGLTWSKRVLAMRMHKYGINVYTPAVLSDGTLLVFTEDFAAIPGTTSKYSNMWAVASHDGGVTFGKPRKIGGEATGGQAYYEKLREGGIFYEDTPPAFAADGNPASPYRDHVYGAYTLPYGDVRRIVFTRSVDGGQHWSKPVRIDPDVPAGAQQYQQAVAVNAQGQVAVTWFDTRGNPKGYRQYATISLDGGATFLPAHAISSRASNPAASGNVVFEPSFTERIAHKHIGVYFVSGYSRWPMGGDYNGLAAAADGTFHAFWPDGRNNNTEPWTATFWAGAPPDTPSVHEADVSADMSLDFSPGRYDSATHVFTYYVRLKNTSAHPVYGPFTAVVSDIYNPYFVAHHETHAFDKPTITGASNGKSGIGATFSYANAMGDLRELAPGASTGAVAWHFKVPLTANPYLGVAVRGYVP